MSTEVTLIEKPGRKAVLTKVISLFDNGSIKSDGSQCILSSGIATRAKADTASELAKLITSCKPNQAIALGRLKEGVSSPVDIVTKAKLKKLTHIARTREYIDYLAGVEAWALLDYDTKGMPAHISQKIDDLGGVWNAIVSVAPALARAARVSRSSTSSGLYRKDTGEKFPGSGGAHFYIKVRDGSLIHRFLDNLHNLLWLNGFGWHVIGKEGQLLERSPVDRAVGLGERLCFEGAPIVKAPLAQDASLRVAIDYDGEAIDTSTAVPPFTEYSTHRIHEAMKASAASLEREARAVRDEHRKTLANKIASKYNVPLVTAKRLVSSQYKGVLLPYAALEFDDLGPANVQDVLSEPEKYIGETLADPFEGVEYGRCKAQVMEASDGGLLIHSFAHGGQIFHLRHDLKSAIAALKGVAPDGAVDFAMNVFKQSELEADEWDIFAKAVNDISKVGMRAITARMKKELREHHKAQQQRNTEGSKDKRVVRVRPFNDEELLPTASFLDELLSHDASSEPPMRSASGNFVAVRDHEPWALHLLSSAGVNAESGEREALKPPAEPSLLALSPIEIEMMIERYVRWRVITKENDYDGALGRAHIDALQQFRPSAIPTVRAINTAPLVDLNGSLIDGEGFDRRTGLFHRFDPVLRDTVPTEQPLPDDVRVAIAFLLDEWLVDVALSPVGKLVAIMMALTVMLRVLLPERPAFFVTAGQRGGGKTTLVHMIVQAVLGRRASANAWSNNSEERKKALFSYLRQGGPMLIWDNIYRGATISCSHIEAALTSPEISDRVLGESRAETVPSTAVMVFTGNAILPKGDMASRSLIIALNIDRPDPENRTFAHPEPVIWTEQNRPKIMKALYTVAIAGALNRPSNQVAKTRFKDWYKRVGWPVEFAARLIGVDLDCTALMRQGEAEDEEANAVSMALNTFIDVFKEKPFTSREIVGAMDVVSSYWFRESATPEEKARAEALEGALSGLIGKRLDRPTAHSIGKLLQARLVGRPGWVGDGNSTAILRRKEGHNENSYTVEIVDPLRGGKKE